MWACIEVHTGSVRDADPDDDRDPGGRETSSRTDERGGERETSNRADERGGERETSNRADERGGAHGTAGGGRSAGGRVSTVSQPWADAHNRWLQAAELLASAGRSPADLREWLGSGWTGKAADGFGAWGEELQDATRRAAAALTDAAASAAALSTKGSDAAQYLLPQTDLDALDDGVRRVSAVLIPGERRSAPSKSTGTRRQQTPGSGRRSGTGGVTFPADRHAKVQSWIDEATDILHQEGYTDKQIDRDAIATIIRYESNGNPSAVNGSDSNAASGNHSAGLMQTIPPTFRHYALPGHTRILNPVDNIIAGVRYAVERYGSVSKVPGVVAVAAGHRYVGY